MSKSGIQSQKAVYLEADFGKAQPQFSFNLIYFYILQLIYLLRKIFLPPTQFFLLLNYFHNTLALRI